MYRKPFSWNTIQTGYRIYQWIQCCERQWTSDIGSFRLCRLNCFGEYKKLNRKNKGEIVGKNQIHKTHSRKREKEGTLRTEKERKDKERERVCVCVSVCVSEPVTYTQRQMAI